MREITTSYYRVAEVVKRRFWSMLPSESLKRSRSCDRPGYISTSLTSIFLFLLLSDLQLAEGGLYGVLISGVARYGFHIYWCHVRHFQNHRFWGAPTNVCKIRLVVCCSTCFNMQMLYCKCAYGVAAQYDTTATPSPEIMREICRYFPGLESHTD